MKDLRQNNASKNNKIHPINTSKCFSTILDHLICSTNLPRSPPGQNHPRRIITANLPPKLINSSTAISGSVPNSDQPMISLLAASTSNNTNNRHRYHSGSANSLDHSHRDITVANISNSTGNSAQTHQPGLVARLMGLESMPPDGDASATSALNLRSRSLNSLNLFPDSLNRTSLLSRSSSSSSPQQPRADDPHRRHHHRRVQSSSTTSISYVPDYKLADLFALTDPADCSLPSQGEEFSFYTAKQTETVTGAAGEATRSCTKTDGVISRAVTSRNDNVVIRDYKMDRPIMRRNEGWVDELKEKNIKYRKKKEQEVTAVRRKADLNKEGSNRNPCSRHGLNATSRSSSSSSKVNSGELGTGVKANHRLIKIKKKTKNKEERSNGSGVAMMGQVGDVIAMRKNSRIVHYDDDDDHPPPFVWKQSTSDLKLMNNIDQTQKSPVSVLDHQSTFEYEFFLSGSSPDSEKTGRMLTFSDAAVTPPRSRKGKPRRQREENEMIRSPPSPKRGRSFLVNQKNDSNSDVDKCNLTEKLDQSSSTEDFVQLLTTMCDLAAQEFMKDSDWTDVGNNHGGRLTLTPGKVLFDESCVGELCADLAQGTLDVLLDQILNELVC